MKKCYLFSAVLLVLVSANGFANTGMPGETPVKDSGNAAKATTAVQLISPVILSFKGTINASSNKLNWRTENEQGMKSYTIERSNNNRDFYPIAVMPAMNEKGLLFYEFPDKDAARLTAQTLSYRLKVTDANNNDKYSSVIILNQDGKNGAVAIR